MFLFISPSELEKAASELQKHFACLGLIMQFGNSTNKSKFEVMYFSPHLQKQKHWKKVEPCSKTF